MSEPELLHQFRIGHNITIEFFGGGLEWVYFHKVFNNPECLLEHPRTNAGGSRSSVVIDIARVKAGMRFNHAYVKVNAVGTNVLDTSQVSSDCRDTYYSRSELVARPRRGLDLDLPVNLLCEIKYLRVELEPSELGFDEVCHFESWTER